MSKNYKQLSLEHRYQIQSFFKTVMTQKSIAGAVLKVGRHTETRPNAKSLLQQAFLKLGR